MKAVNVSVVAITDFDILNSSQNMKTLTEAFGIDWDTQLKADMKVIYDSINAQSSGKNNSWDYIKKTGKAGLIGDAPAAYSRVEKLCKAFGLFIVPVGEMECFDMGNSDYLTKRKDGRVRPAHDVLMEEVLGRPLKPNEVVHHKNENKRDNRLENLEVMDKADHSRLHHTGISPNAETVQRLRESHAGKVSEKRNLSDEQVREIADRLLEGERVMTLAREYGISKGTIAGIRDGKTYRNCLEDFSDDMFPLQKKRVSGHESSARKLDDLEVGLIRIDLMEGKSLRSIAKQHGVSASVIKCIRDGETYQELPWPVVAEKLFQTKSPEMLAEILLNQPMSEKEEYKALKEDYHLLPDLYSVTMLKMVRRAMQGEDPELATMLLLMAGYGDQLMEFIQKDSVIWQTLLSDEENES